MSLPRPDKLENFMRHAESLATNLSKDSSSKIAALFLSPDDFDQITQGYNGMPRGVDELPVDRQTRPTKYWYFEHAERNAIYNLARRTLKGSVMLSSDVPTLGCLRAALAVGAREVYFPLPAEVSAELEAGLAMCRETAVKVGFTFGNSIMGDSSARARKLSGYLAALRNMPGLLGKDPHGSAALFLSSSDFSQLAQGYSGMPRGADDSQLERYEQPLRERWVEGSVRNAIYNLVRPTLKGSIALVTATTCVECARAVASVGAKYLAYREPNAEFMKRWGSSIETALAMMDELGVTAQALTSPGQ